MAGGYLAGREARPRGRRARRLPGRRGGHLRKTRHLIPKEFTHAREGEQEICVSLPKDMVHDSPKVTGDDVDRDAAARHYGLASAEGDLDEADLDGPERDAEAAGLVSTERRRADVRTHKHHERFPPSPSFLGDRKRNARGR